MNVGNEETDLRLKLVVLTVCLGQKTEAQIQKKNQPIKEKSFAEQTTVFTFVYRSNGNHSTDLSTVGQVISERHWKFSEIVNNYGLKRDYFPLFSRTTHTILKIFSQHSLGRVGRGYCKKQEKLCLPNIHNTRFFIRKLLFCRSHFFTAQSWKSRKRLL